MAVGDTTDDAVVWVPGESKGRDIVGRSHNLPIYGGFQIIGPFDVTFNDYTAMTTGTPQQPSGLPLTTLPANTTIMKTWAIFITPFNVGSGTVASLSIGVIDRLGNEGWSSSSYDPVNSQVPGIPWQTEGKRKSETPIQSSYVIHIDSPCDLYVTYGSDGIPTQGHAQIFAIIATPAI